MNTGERCTRGTERWIVYPAVLVLAAMRGRRRAAGLELQDVGAGGVEPEQIDYATMQITAPTMSCAGDYGVELLSLSRHT